MLGPQDGLHGRSNIPEYARAKAGDGLRQDHHLEAERWPALGTVLRVLAAIALLIVVGGWILSALNA